MRTLSTLGNGAAPCQNREDSCPGMVQTSRRSPAATCANHCRVSFILWLIKSSSAADCVDAVHNTPPSARGSNIRHPPSRESHSCKCPRQRILCMLFLHRADSVATFWRSSFASMATSTSCGRHSGWFWTPRAQCRATLRSLPSPHPPPTPLASAQVRVLRFAMQPMACMGPSAPEVSCLGDGWGGALRDHGRSMRAALPRHVLTDPPSLAGITAPSSICNARHGLRVAARRVTSSQMALRGPTRVPAVLADAPPTPGTYESHGAGTRVMIIGATPDLRRVGGPAWCVMLSLLSEALSRAGGGRSCWPGTRFAGGSCP